jgi:hypothetical protein
LEKKSLGLTGSEPRIVPASNIVSIQNTLRRLPSSSSSSSSNYNNNIALWAGIAQSV